MRNEYTRQTRWAAPPEPVGRQRTPPGAPYVKQVIWLACNRCDLQVHAPVLQMVAEGVSCPECGARLADAVAANVAEAVVRVREYEERSSHELAREENPCCD